MFFCQNVTSWTIFSDSHGRLSTDQWKLVPLQPHKQFFFLQGLSKFPVLALHTIWRAFTEIEAINRTQFPCKEEFLCGCYWGSYPPGILMFVKKFKLNLSASILFAMTTFMFVEYHNRWNRFWQVAARVYIEMIL